MGFIKIDTSGMNKRYGRGTPTQKSQQVTSFNTPSKNRAPDIPKTEAKEGDILSFFDDGKGKVLTSFDGGYQSSNTVKISDMNRVDQGMSAVKIDASGTSRITFKGVVQAGLIGQNIITIDANNITQYIPSGTEKLYLDGSQGGEIGSFVRANVACRINEIIIDDAGHFDACIVILESGSADWTFEFGDASGNNDLVMDSDDLYYIELDDDSSGAATEDDDLTITSGGRALFTRSSNDWKLQSLSSLDGIIMQTHTLQPISDDTSDLGSSGRAWKNLYLGANFILYNTGSVPGSPTSGVALYAQDVSSSSELKVKDEAGNVTTLSPHNFSLLGKPSEDMAWAYYSESEDKKINVDMLKLARLVESLSGEKLVYIEDKNSET